MKIINLTAEALRRRGEDPRRFWAKGLRFTPDPDPDGRDQLWIISHLVLALARQALSAAGLSCASIEEIGGWAIDAVNRECYPVESADSRLVFARDLRTEVFHQAIYIDERDPDRGVIRLAVLPEEVAGKRAAIQDTVDQLGAACRETVRREPTARWETLDTDRWTREPW